MIDRRRVLTLSAAALAPLAARAHGGPLPGLRRTQVGDAVVTALLDGYIALDPAMLAGVDEETVSRLLEASFLAPGPVDTAINAYLIETAGRTILVDGGAGSAMGETAGDLTEHLAAADAVPSAIDTVVATHLHPDHVGAFATASGAAAFPHAEMIVHEADLAYWGEASNFDGAPETMRAFARMARDAIAPYADRTVAARDGHEVAPGVTLMHLPGHTPGHSGLMIESDGESLLLWGDIVHVGPIQFARPGATIPFDVDQAQAAATRARVMDMVAADRLEIGGSHVVFPSFGRLTAEAEGYAFHPSRYDFRA